MSDVADQRGGEMSELDPWANPKAWGYEVSDVAEVKEALKWAELAVPGGHMDHLADAARRWVRVVSGFPSDEQVEAAARAWCEANGHFFDSCAWSDQHLEHARAALVAAWRTG